MGEEVVHDRTLVALGKVEEGATLSILQLVKDCLGAQRTLRCCPLWARCVRPLPRLSHPWRS